MPRPDFIVIGRIIGIALTAALAIALIWSGIDDMGRLANPRCVPADGADPDDSFTRVTVANAEHALSAESGRCFGHGLNGPATLPNDDTVSVTAGYLPAGYEWRDPAATLAGATGKLVNRVLVLLAGVASLLTFGVLAVRELR